MPSMFELGEMDGMGTLSEMGIQEVGWAGGGHLVVWVDRADVDIR